MVRSDRAHVSSDADTHPVGNPLTISHMPSADLNPAINDTSVDVIPSNRSAPTSLEISSGVDEFDRESAFVGHEMELAKNSHSVSVFLLVNTMIGSGILNQPFVFKNMGILGALPSYIVAAVAMWYSLVILTDVGVHYKIHDYSNLAKKALGYLGEQLTDASIVIAGFGAILSYILIIGELLSSMLIDWGCESDFCEITSVMAWVVTIFVLPTCLMRHFGHLAYVSVFSIFAISLVLLLVMIGGPIEGRKNGTDSGPVEYFHAYGMLQSIGSIVFALNCVAANFQAFVSSDDKTRTLESWKLVTVKTNVIGGSMCFFMGLAGYLSFREHTEGEILTNFTAPGFAFFKMMVVIHLIAYIPIDFVVMRYSVVKIALGVKAENLATLYHVSLTVVLLILALVVVIVLLATGYSSGEAFSLILDFSGGIAGGFISFLLPGIIYLKLMPPDSQYYTAAKCIIAFGVSVTVSVITGTALSVESGDGT